MKIDRLNGYTLVVKTNIPFLAYVFLCLTIASSVGFLSLNDIEPKSLCAMGAFLFGLITMLITKRSKAIFDSRKREVTVSSGAIAMKSREPISFDLIKAVKIERSSINGKTFGRIVLVLEDSVVPLSPSRQALNQQLEKDARQLIRFVGTKEPLTTYEFASPVQKTLSTSATRSQNNGTASYFDDVDNEVIDLIRKKRLIEAIKLHRSKTGLGLKESKDVVDEIQRRIKNGSM